MHLLFLFLSAVQIFCECVLLCLKHELQCVVVARLFPLLDSCEGSWRGFLSAHRLIFLGTLTLLTNKFFPHHGLLTSCLIIIFLCVFISNKQNYHRWMPACLFFSSLSWTSLCFQFLSHAIPDFYTESDCQCTKV